MVSAEQACLAQRRSGAVVGIGSVSSIGGLPGHGAYCASKASVISWCESLRGELRTIGVKVVTICPDYIDTSLTWGNPHSMPFLMPASDFSQKAIAANQSRRELPGHSMANGNRGHFPAGIAQFPVRQTLRCTTAQTTYEREVGALNTVQLRLRSQRTTKKDPKALFFNTTRVAQILL